MFYVDSEKGLVYRCCMGKLDSPHGRHYVVVFRNESIISLGEILPLMYSTNIIGKKLLCPFQIMMLRNITNMHKAKTRHEKALYVRPNLFCSTSNIV